MVDPHAGSMPIDQGNFDSSKMYVWVKGLEGKLNSLMREVDLVKNDLIKKNASLSKEVKSLNSEVLELKRGQESFSSKMDLIIKELKQTAGSEEVMVIKKYIELWNPLQFVTQRDLERTVDAQLMVKGGAAKGSFRDGSDSKVSGDSSTSVRGDFSKRGDMRVK